MKSKNNSIKKKLLLTLLGGIAFTSQAQSSLIVFGLIDTGYARIENADNYKSAVVSQGNAWNGPINGGLSSSRYGAIGSYGLTNDLRLIGILEAALYPTNFASGNTENQGTDRYNATIPKGAMLFSREETIGLAGDRFGSLKVGRSTTISYEQTGKFDPISAGPGLGNLGAIGSLSVYDLSRANNQIKYYTPNFAGFEGGLAFSALGGTGDLKDGTTREIYLGYRATDFQLFTTYLGTTTFTYNQFGLTSSNSNVQKYYGVDSAATNGSPGLQVFQFGGIYNYEKYKFNLGYDTRKDLSNAAVNGSNSINVAYTGVRYKANTAHQVALGYYYETNNTVTSGKGNQATIATLQYIFTPYKNFDIYGIYSRVTNQSGTSITLGDNANIFVPSNTNTGSTPNPGENQVGYAVGLRYQFDHVFK